MPMTAGSLSFGQIDGVAWADPGRATSICSLPETQEAECGYLLYLFLCQRADAMCRPGAPSTNAQLGKQHKC